MDLVHGERRVPKRESIVHRTELEFVRERLPGPRDVAVRVDVGTPDRDVFVEVDESSVLTETGGVDRQPNPEIAAQQGTPPELARIPRLLDVRHVDRP
jgi:hypothetical protein